MEPIYVIKCGTKFIGVDQASGGYPFETERLDIAQLWYGEKRALEYMRGNPDWKLVRVVTQE